MDAGTEGKYLPRIRQRGVDGGLRLTEPNARVGCGQYPDQSREKRGCIPPQWLKHFNHQRGHCHVSRHGGDGQNQGPAGDGLHRGKDLPRIFGRPRLIKRWESMEQYLRDRVRDCQVPAKNIIGWKKAGSSRHESPGESRITIGPHAWEPPSTAWMRASPIPTKRQFGKPICVNQPPVDAADMAIAIYTARQIVYHNRLVRTRSKG